MIVQVQDKTLEQTVSVLVGLVRNIDTAVLNLGSLTSESDELLNSLLAKADQIIAVLTKLDQIITLLTKIANDLASGPVRIVDDPTNVVQVHQHLPPP